ncbi:MULTISPECIES: hypothetical protein [Legionella]|uniref:Dot/Icm T4SS effector n=1 Tax=Legionella resiliens TaxID=2905958 RepID=A0ABS8X202_9GAMM|nr:MULTISPECIES: hypothetical protein [unclassified Legionella]MCE0723618.1 hypothetical protein [Legionella sp. 9fVS26]MCE3532771.1 hypothetical protein [Legionella sp. 8cVS16]QLZ68906.1 hypothetical protein FOLKNPGA_01686 [Legionella sp. PC1000]
MKLMSVIGINLGITKWIVSESKSPFDEEDTLCVYECTKPEEAEQMMENIKSAFVKDSMDLDIGEQESPLLDYYLETHGNYVVASMKFLERYFDGKVEEVHQENKFRNQFFLIGKLMEDEDKNLRSRLIVVNTSENSIIIKHIVPEQIEEPDLIDFAEEYLGVTLYTKRNKGSTAQIKEAYNFNGLFLPDDNFSVLWLPAKPYQGHAMFTAYGCSSHRVAKILETKIREDENKKQKVTPLVSNREHMTMVCVGPILLASGEYLEQIYGKPIHVPLVNDLVKQGLADKQAKQRATVVDKIYAEWNEKTQLRSQTYPLKLQSRTTPTFFASQLTPTGKHRNLLFASSSINGEMTIVPKPDPMPYPGISTEEKTIVPTPAPLPYPFMHGSQNSVTTQKMVAPRAQSMFFASHSDEPLKTFTEEEYLGLFQ